MSKQKPTQDIKKRKEGRVAASKTRKLEEPQRKYFPRNYGTWSGGEHAHMLVKDYVSLRDRSLAVLAIGLDVSYRTARLPAKAAQR